MRTWTHCTLAAAMTATLLGARVGAAQEPKNAPVLTLTPATRTEVIEGIITRLNGNYVFPDVAKKMEEALRKRVKAGEYDKVTDGFKFAQLLTTHLQEISRDKHLRVRCSQETLPKPENGRPSEEERKRELEFLRQVNYGFEKAERLPGNIGYIDMRFFADPQLAGNTCAAALTFLADTDALILDLRENGGGDPAMVALLCSYFFEERTHLNDLYFRPTDTTEQFWTQPSVPGKRYLGKDLYVLTSKYTFSGAEECSYNLKNLKRATLIGETTGGGAHPGGMERINDHFGVWVPSGRAINAVTKDNWEGKGVTPHISVPADKALKTAHLKALEKQIEKTTDIERKERLKEAAAKLKKELEAKPEAEKSAKAP